MKKNKFHEPKFRYLKKLLMTMKICLFFLLISVATVNASISYSQNTKLTLDLQNATMKELIQEIESQSEFIFVFYDNALNLKQKVSIRTSNQPIEKILDKVLESTGNTYAIFDRQIVIGKKNPETGSISMPAETITDADQRKEITGKVTDAQKLPLPGVSVVVKGTTQGTITDADGNFRLSYTGEAKTITFSFVGMKTQDITVGNITSFNIVMEDETVGVDEVVVVGYGTQKKATITGAIASLGTKDLLQSPQANVSNALVGRMPGLIAVQRSGEPGNDQSQLRIRGVGTFSGSQDPLVMIDGIETENYNNIDPNEIESISVLKDASATAVYGVRGANGVLLITTKRGKLGKPQVSYTANLAVTRFTDLRESMNAYDYARSFNEALKYDSYISGGYTPKFTEEAIAKYKSGEDPIFYPNINWFDEMLKPTSSQIQHNITINGGTEKVKYFLSAGYFNQEGLFKHADILPEFDAQPTFKRYNFRSNFDFEITKRFSAIVNLSSQIENRAGTSSIGRFVESLSRANPINVPGVIDGKIVELGIAGSTNPYSYLLRDGFRREYRNYLDGSVRLNYKLDFILEGLSAHGTVSYKNYNNQVLQYSKRLVTHFAKRLPDNSVVYVPQGDEGPFGFSEAIGKNRKVYSEFGFNYARTFDRHNVTGLFLYNQSKYFDPNLAFAIPNGYQGVVGRATYDFEGRYLAEVNVGYNGTENFAEGKRYGFFPAYSLGWVLSEEPFFPENNIVSLVKFRASQGEVGNDKIGGDRFLYRPSSYVYSGQYYYGEVGSSYNKYNVSAEGKIGNPDLTWERAIKKDLGMELGLWKDKIRVSMDLFLEKRDNILANRGTVPAIVGANLPAYNLGKMKNSGFDGDFTYNERIDKFDFWVKCNFTFARNEIEFQDEVPRPFTYQYRTGQRFGQYFGLVAEGFYNTWEEVNDPARPSSQYQNNKIQPGDLKYRDVNGDGIINDDDQVPIGYSNFPEKIFGLSLGGRYKGFDFSLLFQGAGNVSINYTRRYQDGFGEGGNGTANYFLTSWSQERYEKGLSIDFPHFAAGSDAQKHNYAASSFWTRDASYVRLKNIEVGYTFSTRLMSKINLSSARIYINGNNLYTWDSMFPGVDPEAAMAAVNFDNYPVTSTVNLGINVKF